MSILIEPVTPRCQVCGEIIESGQNAVELTSFGDRVRRYHHYACAGNDSHELTLAEVKEAGTRAFHMTSDLGEFMWDGALTGEDSIWWHSWSQDGRVHSSSWAIRGDLPIPQDRWVHFADCDCRFCRPGH